MKRVFAVAALLGPLAFSVPALAEITYADILADPDNPSLNQQFARQRREQGDAKAAWAAVERVLVAEPTNLGARLFRAEILAALGADLQAESELRALAALPLPADIKARVAAMRETLAQRRKRLKTRVNLGVGYKTNDNATNWPSDNNVLFQGAPLPESNPYTQERFGEGDNPITAKTSDQAASASLAVTSSYDLGGENLRDVFINLGSVQTGESDTVYLDNTTQNIGLGLTYKTGALTIVPRFSLAQVDNDFEDRLGTYNIESGSLTGEWQLAPRHRLTLSGGATRLAFRGIKESNNTLTHAGSLGYNVTLPGGVALSLGVFNQDVDSRTNRDLDKKLNGASMSVRFGVARGQFLTLGGASSEAKHDNAYSQSRSTTNPQGTKREDEITNLNASYLVLGGAFSSRLNNVFATLGYQATETKSNILGFSQERNVASFGLTYALNF